MRIFAAWLPAVLISSVIAAVHPVVPGDSRRGEKVFENQQCIRCHAVNGRGGKMGLDLGRSVSRSYTPARLASTMWNHAPVMWSAIEAGGIRMPRLAPKDAADLFAFFYSTRFFDSPGDATRGKATFGSAQCGQCHGITASRAEGAIPVAKWESLGDPVLLVQQMWNHSYRMRMAFARQKLEWQQLTSEQLNDILTYLRTLPETQHLVSRFSNTSGDNGHRIFESKGCVNCHVGKLALENRLRNMTLTDIAVDMWNHAPRMAQQVPTLTPDEMRQLLSFLWMRQFVAAEGNLADGKRVFAERRCSECHYGGSNGAPQLSGQARRYSEVSVISAIWGHGPQMLNRMKQAKIAWPQFANPQELVDLLAYLNSIQ
jgi:mono/diheme cytochrome c family protein